jgi:predicted acylesterase/phospholipase RssA
MLIIPLSFVVATRASNSEPAILRSFENTESDNLLFGECKVWEACRATSAAPTFFDSITIGRRKQKFADGGMVYNNPVEQVHQEAETLWPGQEKLLISIGTGDAPGASFNGNIQTLVNAMKAIVTNTQIKADDFHKSHHSLIEAKLYFRFSVAQGLENVGLQEYDAVDKIADATDVYIARPESRQKFEDCVQSLLEEKSKGTRLTTLVSDSGRQSSVFQAQKSLPGGVSKMIEPSSKRLMIMSPSLTGVNESRVEHR